MAVPEVAAGIRRQVVVREAGAYVDGHRGVRHAVIERRSVGVAVEVDGVLLEQVRPHDHADVAEGEEHLVVLIERNQRRRNIAVHHPNIYDRAGVDMAIDYRRRRRRCIALYETSDRGQPRGWIGVLEGIHGEAARIDDEGPRCCSGHTGDCVRTGIGRRRHARKERACDDYLCPHGLAQRLPSPNRYRIRTMRRAAG